MLLPASGPGLAATTAASPIGRATLAERLLGARGFVACSVAIDATAAALSWALVAQAGASSAGYALCLAAVTVGALAWRGVYDGAGRRSALDLLAPIAGAVVLAALTALALAGSLAGESRAGVGEALVAAGLALVTIVAARAGLLRARAGLRAAGALARPTIILGAGAIGERIAHRLLADPGLGLQPIGFVDGPGERSPSACRAGLPVLGSEDELPAIAASTGARELIVAFPCGARDADLQPVVATCMRMGLRVSIVPRLFEAVNGRQVYEPLDGLPLHALRAVDPDGWRFAVKHAFDFTVALAALAVLAPLLLAIGLAVRLESPGPALFRQRRVGRDGQVFDVLKFRSMRQPAEAAAFVPLAGRAPGGVEGIDRRTRVGRMLRRTSLDELPQLVNVVRGEMSLVGPRPERPEFVALFAHDIRRYDDRQRVRSGLTGWAQVAGLRGQTSLQDRIELDNFYIEQWSLGLDLKILLRTPGAMLTAVED